MPGTSSSVPHLPLPPFRWISGNLGLSLGLTDNEPFIDFVDSVGKRWETDSVEFILAIIDHFPSERDRQRLLGGAALHYGFDDAWILIKGRNA